MEIYPSVRSAGERRVHRNFGAIKSGESSERNARVHPGAAAIWCDVSPENAQAVFDILNPLGYELYAAAAPERVPLDRASWDTLALPRPVAAGPAPKVPC